MIMSYLIIDTYISLMYELKKIGKVFTSKFDGTGPLSYEKKNLPVRGLTNVEKHWSNLLQTCITYRTIHRTILRS
jgi:hypothetical protein